MQIKIIIDRITLRNQQSLTQLLLNNFEKNSRDFLWQTNSQGKISYGSSSLLNIYGAKKIDEDAVFSELFDSDIFQQKILNEKIKSTEPFSMVQGAVRHNDAIDWWGISGDPVFNNEGVWSGFSGFGTNITAIKQKEEAEQRKRSSQIIIELAASIAHDFNNSLATIWGNIEILTMLENSNEHVKEYTNKATMGILSAKNLARQLLQVAQEVVLTPESLDLKDEISKVKAEVLAVYRDGLQIKIDIPARETVFVDSLQFNRAVRNIVENSSLAMKGEGLIIIEIEKISKDSKKLEEIPQEQLAGEYYAIKITDQGPGFVL